MRKIEDLHPDLQVLAKELKNVCAQNGLKIAIGECLRTVAEQDALYAKGRTAPGKIVTNAKGSSYSSMHQWGIAFDFYRDDGKGAYADGDGFFEKVGKIGQSLGLEWGGEWKSITDLPHFQLAGWGKTPAKLKKQYGTPAKFFKAWEVSDMTAEEKKAFERLEKRTTELEARLAAAEGTKEKIYHYTQDLPDWAKATVQKLLDRGWYSGAADDDLNLPESLARVLVINDRAGLYG